MKQNLNNISLHIANSFKKGEVYVDSSENRKLHRVGLPYEVKHSLNSIKQKDFTMIGKKFDSESNLSPILQEEIIKFSGLKEEDLKGGKVKIEALKDEEWSINCLIETKDYYLENNYYGQGVAEITFMEVKQSGGGKGLQILENQISTLKTKGFKKIILQANRDDDREPKHVGYYTWARFGFMPTLSDSFKVNDHLKKNSRKEASLEELMSTEEGRGWWKQNGITYKANFDLGEDSYSMELLKAYKGSKF